MLKLPKEHQLYSGNLMETRIRCGILFLFIINDSTIKNEIKNEE